MPRGLADGVAFTGIAGAGAPETHVQRPAPDRDQTFDQLFIFENPPEKLYFCGFIALRSAPPGAGRLPDIDHRRHTEHERLNEAGE